MPTTVRYRNMTTSLGDLRALEKRVNGEIVKNLRSRPTHGGLRLPSRVPAPNMTDIVCINGLHSLRMRKALEKLYKPRYHTHLVSRPMAVINIKHVVMIAAIYVIMAALVDWRVAILSMLPGLPGVVGAVCHLIFWAATGDRFVDRMGNMVAVRAFKYISLQHIKTFEFPYNGCATGSAMLASYGASLFLAYKKNNGGAVGIVVCRLPDGAGRRYGLHDLASEVARLGAQPLVQKIIFCGRLGDFNPQLISRACIVAADGSPLVVSSESHDSSASEATELLGNHST